jgi:hypothetical protein
VEKLLQSTPVDDLPSLYKRAYLDHAYGGAVTRHILLVRHGQYDEQRSLARTLSRPDGVRDRDFGARAHGDRGDSLGIAVILTVRLGSGV